MNRKPLHSNLWKAFLALGLALTIPTRADETIRYYGGPNLMVGFYGSSLDLDLNWDGESDFGFESGGPVCTTGIPPTCTSLITTKPIPGVSVLSMNNYVAAIPAGALIGAEPVANTQWKTNALTASVQVTGLSSGDAPVSPIQALSDGYCGFQFTEQDGIHFGWMHLRIANAWLFQPPYVFNSTLDPIDQAIPMTTAEGLQIISFIGPNVTVTEWAYETRPNTAIAAGEIPRPSPMAAGMGSRAGNLRLIWQAEAGAAYYVQFKDALTATSWEVLNMRVVATGSSAGAEILTPGVTRFFRVVRAD